MGNLTNAQKSIWVTEQYYRGSSINNICGKAIIEEQIDFEKLKEALEIVRQKHDSFKLRFKIEEGEVNQVLSDKIGTPIETLNVATLEELEKAAEKIVRTPFKLENSEIFKFYIFKFNNGEGGFMLNFHHLIADAWTLALICNEIIKTYSQLKQNKEIETKAIYSYIDYIKSEQEYQNTEKFQKDKAYWEEKFATIPEVATIPGSKANTDASNPAGERMQVTLDVTIVEKLKQYCKENKISLYNFFMAIYAIYIGEISNLDEFVIGTPILNRTNFKEKNAAGMFINMAPFKINMSQTLDFKTFVKNIALDSMNMLKHQKYSYQCLLENLREKHKEIPNLYNILLSYQITNTQMSGENITYKTDWTFNGCCAENMDIQIFDLNDTGSLNIAYDYKKCIYEKKDIENIHKRILNIIEQVISKENIDIKDIEIVTPEEKQKLTVDFNKTELKYNETETVIKMFENQALKTPDKTAIVSNKIKLTYKELNEKANILSRKMKREGVKPDNIIGIMINRSPEMIIGLLAILKCGATYLPIDPEYPEERISYMIENSETKLVLVNNNTEKYVPKNCSKIKVEMSELTSNIDILNEEAKTASVAYLIYTSGSTGKPKGVQVTNKNLTNFVHGMKQIIDFSENKVMVSVTTICFDIFGLEMWCSLTSGLTLVIANEEEQNTPSLLNNLCLENKVNMIQTTPSRYSVIFQEKGNLKFLENITEILVGGEGISEKLLFTMQKNSKARIFNMYGPTETTIWSTVKELTNAETVTVGKPIANTQCYILNKNHKLLPLDVAGELYIGGDGVSNGYLKREELNEEKFINSPFIDGKKIYNTNDLAYYTENGEIVHLGRTDFQVKIRGFRIELGEIENAIEKNEEINQSIVIKRKLENGHEVLIAYYATKTDDVKELNNKLKEALSSQLPQYMVPQYFVRLEKMPHTPNGKIDRKLLPDPEGTVERAIVKPRNELDKEIIAIIEKMLHIENVSLLDTLLDLGGDSLTAITLSTKIQSKYGVQINIKEILSNYTVKDISNYIEENKLKAKIIKIEKAPEQKLYPLSSAQRRIYYNAKMIGEENIVYNMPGGILVEEILDQSKVKVVFKKIFERHEALRTKFVLQNENVMQKVEKQVELEIPVYNNKEEEIQKIIKEFSKPFDLEKAPLFRVEIHYIDNKKTLLLIDAHHILMDGTGLNNLIIEFNRLYNGANLKKIPIQYRDYAVWENEYNESEEVKKNENYWVNKFKDSEFSNLNLPYDYKMSATRTYKGNRITKVIDEKEFRKIERYAKKIGVSPYMFFISIFFILLYKYTGQTDITVGSPMANREINEAKRMIGMFVNNIVLRGKINSDETFQEFLNSMKEQVLDDLTYQPYPFDMLVKKLGLKAEGSRNPLFDVMFTYQNKEENVIKIGDTDCHIIEIDNKIAKFNLSLEIKPKTHTINMEYCTDLFKKETIERLFEHYINAIEDIMKDNNIKIKDISIISEAERNRILYRFNDTQLEYPSNKTISELFEKQAQKTPEEIAIVFEGKKLTYKELNEKANQLANYIRNKQIKPNDIVGIMLPRSFELLISILGVLKSGACYIPIDPMYPTKRIEYMLENSQAKLVITSEELCNNINFENKVCADLNNEEIYLLDNKNLKNINSPEDLSYMIYTSGSTGIPKGVMLKHKSLSNLCAYLNNKVEFLQDDCKYKNMASVTTASFDIFVFETLVCLQKGLKIILANEDEQRVPALLDKLIKENNVQAIQMTPSRMQIFLDNIQDMPNLANLKYVTLAGEALPLNLRNKLKQLGVEKIYNGYGPSETTVFSTFTDVTESEEINIGVPLANTQMYILDNNLNVVPIGVAGELYISGDGVGKGYLNREDITKERFIENPFISNSIMYKTGDICKFDNNGELYYLGRIDNQVKVRGLRIELEEIENRILEYPHIEKVKVIKKVVENKEVIVAYFIAKQKVIIHELREYLYNYLPNYMVPAYFVEVAEFPYTPNGKIDKNRLPEIENNITGKAKKLKMPTSKEEAELAKIFEKVLKVDEIGIDDNFFELGGDSITAMMLQSEMLKEGLSITYSDIFKYPSIQRLAIHVKKVTESITIKKAEEKEYYPISSAQKRMYLTSSLDKDSVLYNVTGGILMNEETDFNRLQTAIDIVVERHEVLRTFFEVLENGEIVQKIDKKAKVEIQEESMDTENIYKVFDKYQAPFDLSKAPLLRVHLVKLQNNKLLFMLDAHHIIIDGGSLQIFLHEILEIYNGKNIERLAINYKDFAVWENEQLKNGGFEKSKTFWKSEFEEEIPILNMPTTFTRPFKRDYSGNVYTKTVSKELTKKIEKLAKANNVTPYMIMLSVYYILLYKYTGQNDIIVGTPVSGRIYKELEPLLGMFVNSLPLRQQILSENKFIEFVSQVKEHCIECFSHQDYPFDVLVNELEIPKDPSRNALFDTMFTYQNNGISSEYYAPKVNTSKFDISLEVIPKAENMNLYFEYWTGLFDNKFITRFAKHYYNILQNIVENPDIEIRNISMLGEDEKIKILQEFNDNKMPITNKNIVQIFEEITNKNSDVIAVKYRDKEITYKELDRKANYIANRLKAQGVQKGDVIGVNLNRSIELIISIMATLKLGATYMPMYINYPKERLEFMLQDSGAKALICKEENKLKHAGIEEIIPEFQEIPEEEIISKEEFSGAENAYIIYTSGSTGNPKGVQIKHENLVNFVNAFEKYYENKIDCKDKFLASTNISFDVSIWEIFLPLLNGATLVLYDEEIIQDIFKYTEYIIKNDITGLYIPPNILEEVYYILKESNNIKMNKMLVGVEPIRKSILNKYFNLNNEMIIVNGYGPTETTICCTSLRYEEDEIEGIVSIGKPLINDNIYIVSQDNNIQPIGVNGEIIVTGAGVGNGYINRETETQKSFLPNIFDKTSEKMYKTGDIARWNEDGTISFVGRNDNQVKIAGHRIELNEIDHAIMEYPSIIKSFTNINKKGNKSYIVSYYISEKEIPTTDLKLFLKEKLPEFMVPNFIKQMDKFPLTPNGKIDKNKLTTDFSVKEEFVEPRNEFERKMADIFKKLLPIEKVSIDDNFFEIGGDSLLAIKLQIEALNAGLKITYADIFSNPTIRMLSEQKSRKVDYNIDKDYDYTKINELLINNDIEKLSNKVAKKKINNVLLIGATGFLGIHILEKLILSKANKIYCLVREKSSMAPETRLRNYLEFYFGDKYNKLLSEKIIVINGDITDKKLGQENEESYNALAENIDCVVHTAAIVKHYGQSKKFNDTNIEGTVNVINFCKKHNKKMYYVSTLSVSGNMMQDANDNKQIIFKEKDLYINQDFSNIYIYTKFEAEKKVLEAILKGLDACILRIGNVTNRYSDGQFQINVSENAFLSRIKAILKLGIVEKSLLKHALEFTPVDCCADAIVKIVESDPEFTVFHLFDDKFLNINKLVNMLEELEIKMQVVDDETFRNKIELALKDDKIKNDINGLVTELDENKSLNLVNYVIPNSDFTRKYLELLGFEWPEIDREYIEKYVEYLKKIKYI